MCAAIYFHPNGCSSGEGVATLVDPGTLGVGGCAFNDGAFPNGPSGGYEIQGMDSTVSVTIRQGPANGEVCGQEIISELAQNGCYDLENLSDRIWWSFCTTGVDCPGVSKRSYPPPKRAPVAEVQMDTAGVIRTDEDGDFLVSTKGRRVPVIYTSDLELEKKSLVERQSTTFTPSDDCYLDDGTCQSLADSGSLKALCVDCVQGVGEGVKASSSSTIDCRNSGSACIVTFTDSITVTDTISEDITFGATIGDTGSDGGSVDGSFGFGVSVSIATTNAVAEGLSIPQGKIGYVQFQPQAQLGTVVTTSSSGNVCDSGGLNKICGAQPGILVSSSNDADGQYSVVLTS